MATGDQNDILARLKSFLPRGWFGDFTATPIVSALLTGIASNFVVIYTLIQFFKAQTRLATSSGGWVDMWAADFFGANLPRVYGEIDTAYILRIRAALFQKRITRQAMIDVLTALTGNVPVIFEPNRPLDTGCFGLNQGPASFFGVARFGSMACPFSALITVKGQKVTGNSAGAAYFNAVQITAFHTNSSNGYFASLAAQQQLASNAAIYAAINATRPVATNIGVRIV